MSCSATPLALSNITIDILLSSCHRYVMHPLATGLDSESLDTAYVVSARMHTTVSHRSISYACSTQQFTLTVCFTFVAKPASRSYPVSPPSIQ